MLKKVIGTRTSLPYGIYIESGLNMIQLIKRKIKEIITYKL